MAQALRDTSNKPVFGTELDLTIVTSSVAIGAAGAVDSTIAGYRVAPGVTMTNTGAGTFSLVYPIAPNATILVFVESSAAGTVIDATLTAKSATAGTASITTRNAAGAATNPASGDLIGIIIFGLPNGQAN
jgi:hypothetical protein